MESFHGWIEVSAAVAQSRQQVELYATTNGQLRDKQQLYQAKKPGISRAFYQEGGRERERKAEGDRETDRECILVSQPAEKGGRQRRQTTNSSTAEAVQVGTEIRAAHKAKPLLSIHSQHTASPLPPQNHSLSMEALRAAPASNSPGSSPKGGGGHVRGVIR